VKNLHRLFAAATVVVIGATGVACKSATPYAAKVNGIVVSKAGLEDELDAIRGNKRYVDALKEANVPVDGTGANTSVFSSQFVARILTRRIYLELIHQEFVRRKLKLRDRDLQVAREQLLGSMPGSPEEAEATLDAFPKSYYEEIRRTTAEVFVLQNALADTSPANLRKYYDEHKEQFESVCAAHILVEEKAAADSIVAQLSRARDKAATFAELASAQSKDPGSAANGGDLGCASPANYVAEFKEAVRTQAIGVIGKPVKTDFGYHVIRVDSREAAKPFSEVEQDVIAAVTDTQQGAFNDFLNNASTKAKVEVNPRYGKYDKTGQSPEVVPPTPPAADSGDN
jgi:parvulin-like peptidyl-prolyl isomerase